MEYPVLERAACLGLHTLLCCSVAVAGLSCSSQTHLCCRWQQTCQHVMQTTDILLQVLRRGLQRRGEHTTSRSTGWGSIQCTTTRVAGNPRSCLAAAIHVSSDGHSITYEVQSLPSDAAGTTCPAELPTSTAHAMGRRPSSGTHLQRSRPHVHQPCVSMPVHQHLHTGMAQQRCWGRHHMGPHCKSSGGMTPTLREARSPCATPSACNASTAFVVEAATAGSTSGGRRLTATRRSRQHQFTSSFSGHSHEEAVCAAEGTETA
jgi:hypothetical protein